MKVTANNNGSRFRPVTITFTLESQAELDIMGSLFNVTYVCNILEQMGIPSPVVIYDVFGTAGANIHGHVAAISSKIEARVYKNTGK